MPTAGPSHEHIWIVGAQLAAEYLTMSCTTGVPLTSSSTLCRRARSTRGRRAQHGHLVYSSAAERRAQSGIDSDCPVADEQVHFPLPGVVNQEGELVIQIGSDAAWSEVDSESGQLRQGQRVAVRIEEPGYPVATWSCPNAPVVLVRAVVATECDVRRTKSFDHGTDIRYFPTGDGERLRSEFGHPGQSVDGLSVLEHDGKWWVLGHRHPQHSDGERTC